MTDKPVKRDERRGAPSCSSFELYTRCHGSFLLSKQVPENEKFRGEDAERGDRVHKANELSDLSVLESLSEVDITKRIRSREEEIFTRWTDEFGIKDAVIHREERLWLMQSGVRLFSGKLDFFALSQKTRHSLIIDGKSGRKAVSPPPSNLQLRGQVVLLAANYNVVHARAAIAQPLAKIQPLVDYSPESLYGKDGAWKRMVELIEAIQKPDAPRTPGTHCSLCDARHICPQAQEVTQKVAGLKGLKWSMLSPQRKLELWEFCTQALPIIKAVRENVKAEIKSNPEAIPGLEYKPGSAMRGFEKLPELFMELSKHVLCTPDEFVGLCSLSVGELTEFVRTKLAMEAKEADAWINKTLSPFITLTQKDGSIVRVKEAKSV